MMTMEKIIEYVLYTPQNPNRAVLQSMLQSFLKDNGGGGGAILEEKVINLPGLNGTTTISPEKPEPGDKVTITPNPESGYIVSDVVIVDINGNTIPVTDNGDGTYSYTQPASGTSVIPLVDYDVLKLEEDDTLVYDGGGVGGW